MKYHHILILVLTFSIWIKEKHLKMDKLLILGGTNFIGRNLIEKLIELNLFEITIFNRGFTNPDLFPQINKFKGDRNSKDLKLLDKMEWDYIIDLSCYFPDSIDQILNVINMNIKRYIFISTCSVYDNQFDKSFLRGEDSTILECKFEESIDTSTDTYGKRKAECERRLQKSGLPFFILRPSLVYGRYDNTDRFYYWLFQTEKQNDVIIPNNGQQPFSVTFVDDLIHCIIELIELDGNSEVYNICSSPTLSITKIVDHLAEIMKRNPTRHYAKSSFLKNENIQEWIDLPLWLDCDYFTYDNSKLITKLNYNFIDFEVSLKRTIDYYKEMSWPFPKYGLPDERKEELISKLKNN